MLWISCGKLSEFGLDFSAGLGYTGRRETVAQKRKRKACTTPPFSTGYPHVGNLSTGYPQVIHSAVGLSTSYPQVIHRLSTAVVISSSYPQVFHNLSPDLFSTCG
jgi:hypothetical protein